MTSLLQRAEAINEELLALRHHFHRYPEPSSREVKTGAYIAEYLKGLRLEVHTGVAKTGVIGRLVNGGPTVMLRADMDALEVQEENEGELVSQNPGMMHACGHDAHMACLLGAARLLTEQPPAGSVLFLFQPAEEGADSEGKHGARRVLEEGWMEGVDAVFAQHVTPELPAGAAAVCAGYVSSAADHFWSAILGTGAHGAYPDQGLDAIALTGLVIPAINQITSRRVSALDSSIVTIGRINGGSRHNVITGRVELEGTVRNFKPETRERVLAELERAHAIADALGGGHEFKVERGPAAVFNDAALTTLVQETAVALLGAENSRPGGPMMASEDFSFLSASGVPGCLFRIGSGFPDRINPGLHNPRMLINDAMLPAGAAMMAGVAERFIDSRR